MLKPRDFRAGALEDAVYDAVFQRAGILRVNNIEQLFGAAETLATAKPVYSNRLTILSNSYSLALLTSDTCPAARWPSGPDQRSDPRDWRKTVGLVIRSRTRWIWAIWPVPINTPRRSICCCKVETDGVLVIHAPLRWIDRWRAPRRWWRGLRAGDCL
ncbi:MAG: hypothetical protein IPK63_02080 [Candidatus Competibacteraceae bacterium]|nr:hypothetical protein [Candidatus Competibacteraceae bacterium]